MDNWRGVLSWVVGWSFGLGKWMWKLRTHTSVRKTWFLAMLGTSPCLPGRRSRHPPWLQFAPSCTSSQGCAETRRYPFLPWGTEQSSRQVRSTSAHPERQASPQESARNQEIILGHVYIWASTKGAIPETIHSTLLSTGKIFSEQLTWNRKDNAVSSYFVASLLLKNHLTTVIND